MLLAAADLVTLARTGVEYDYRGDVIDAHAPEMPTRFAKQLAQIVRGAVAIGMDRGDALRLAIRCARDSMPPLRLAIIDDLAAHPHSSTQEVRRRNQQAPRHRRPPTAGAAHARRAHLDEVPYNENGDPLVLHARRPHRPESAKPRSCPDLLVHTPSPLTREEGREDITASVTGRYSQI